MFKQLKKPPKNALSSLKYQENQSRLNREKGKVDKNLFICFMKLKTRVSFKIKKMGKASSLLLNQKRD